MNFFIDSFDNWDTLAHAALGKWTSASGNFLSIDKTVPRTGPQDLQVTYAAASTDSYLGKVIAARQRPTIGFGLRVDTFDATNNVGLLQWLSGATKQVTLVLKPDGTLAVDSGDTGGTQLVATVAGAVVAGAYVYVEMFVIFHATNGFVVINVNGINLLNVGGLDTDPAASNGATQFRLGGFPGGNSVTTSYHFDDLYGNDDTPPYNTGFEATPAQTVRVYEFGPTANGTTVDFLPTPHPMPNWQAADPINALDDTAFVADNTTGDLELYKHGSLPTTVTAVLAVQQSCIAKKVPATGNVSYEAAFVAVSNVMRSGEIEADWDGVNTTDSYAWYLDVLETDPNTQVPFTVAGCNDSEIGVKVALNE